MADSDNFDSNIFEENESEWGQPSPSNEKNYTVKQIDKIDPQKEWGSKDYGNDEKALLKHLSATEKVNVNYETYIYENGKKVGDMGAYSRVSLSANKTSLANIKEEYLNDKSYRDSYQAQAELYESSQSENYEQFEPEPVDPNQHALPIKEGDTVKNVTVSFSDASITSYEQNKKRFEVQQANDKLQAINTPVSLSTTDMEIERKGTIVPEKIEAVDDFVHKKFEENKDGKWKWKENKEIVAFREKEKAMSTRSKSPLVASSMVAVADARGWKELRVKGSDKFRKEAWLEGELRGISVSGYVPTEKDKAELANSLNSIERINVPSKERAIKDAKVEILTKDQRKFKEDLEHTYTHKERKIAQEKYPELKHIYNMENGAKKFASSTSMSKEEQNKFVASVRDKGIDQIAVGNFKKPARIVDNINLQHEQKIEYAR